MPAVGTFFWNYSQLAYENENVQTKQGIMLLPLFTPTDPVSLWQHDMQKG